MKTEVENTLTAMDGLKHRGRPLGSLPVEQVHALLKGRSVESWQLDLRPGDCVLSLAAPDDSDPILEYSRVVEFDAALAADMNAEVAEESDVFVCVRPVNIPNHGACCLTLYQIHARLEERHAKALEAAGWPETMQGLLSVLLAA